MNFKEYYNTKKNIIDTHISSQLKSVLPNKAKFYEMMMYPLSASGKRLRPVLTLMVNDMLGRADENMILNIACASEFIHTYSLVHDDLPSMDNDDLRRGLPTTHIKYGEANAILVGDGLLTEAFTLIASANVSDSIKINAVSELSSGAGADGMVFGQYLDVYSENSEVSEDDLKTIHLYKTGALIRSAVLLGSIVNEASESETNALREYAKNIGMAFQVQDDILDVISDTDSLGKPVGSDAGLNKSTYVKFYGVDGSKKKALEYVETAISHLNMFGNSAGYLCELAKYIIERKK